MEKWTGERRLIVGAVVQNSAVIFGAWIITVFPEAVVPITVAAFVICIIGELIVVRGAEETTRRARGNISILGLLVSLVVALLGGAGTLEHLLLDNWYPTVAIGILVVTNIIISLAIIVMIFIKDWRDRK